jgi:peroxiredoxin
MTQLSDERLDAALRELLARQAEEVAESAWPTEVAAERLAGRLAHPVAWRRSVTIIPILALLALLGAIVTTLAILGPPRPPRPDAASVVARSQALFEDPPPFMATVRVAPGAWPGSTLRLAYDGAGRLRQEVLSGALPSGLAPGSYEIYDGKDAATWDPSTRSWAVSDFPIDSRVKIVPNWVQPGIPIGPGEPVPLVSCDEWTLEAGEMVAGRATQLVSCGSTRFWVDQLTGFLLKAEISGGWPESAEVLELSIGSSPSAGLFSFEAPADAAPWDAPSYMFEVGDPLPDWEAEQLDGEMLTFSALRGSPVALLQWWGPSCATCGQDEALASFDAAYRERGNSIAMFVVMDPDSTDYFLELSAANGYTVPALVGYTVIETWGLQGTYAFATADGRFAGGYLGVASATELAVMLDALAAGAPVPTPDPRGEVLIEGQVAPTWAAPLLGGGSFDLAELRGRPTAVLVRTIIVNCEGCIGQATLSFAEAYAELHDDVNFVLAPPWEEVHTETEEHSFSGPLAIIDILEELSMQIGSPVDDLFVTLEPELSVYPAWDLLPLRVPILVLLDADGAVVETYAGSLDGGGLPPSTELVAQLRDLLGN